MEVGKEGMEVQEEVLHELNNDSGQAKERKKWSLCVGPTVSIGDEKSVNGPFILTLLFAPLDLFQILSFYFRPFYLL